MINMNINKLSKQVDDDVEIPENVVTFNARLEPENPRPGEHARIILDLKIHHGWHVFSVIPSEGDFSPIPTTLTFKDESLLMIGPAYESNPITAYNSVLDMVLSFHEERVSLFQNIQIEKELSGGSLWKWNCFNADEVWHFLYHKISQSGKCAGKCLQRRYCAGFNRWYRNGAGTEYKN